MKRKRDFQEFLITTGCHFQLLGATEEVEGTNEDIEGQDWVDNDLTGDAEILEAIGAPTGLSQLWTTVSIYVFL